MATGENIGPRVEGTVGLGGGRRLGFAEFGPPSGRSVVWLHGTPGARRQIPAEARAYAEVHGLRIVGIDRPGIGSSTPHLYDDIAGFAPDLEVVADRLGLDDLAVIGLSGGGPYALAAGALLDRVRAVGVLGGVAPTVGPDAIGGGLVALGKRLAPAIAVARVPIGVGLTGAIRLAKPFASRGLDLYARLSPEGDRRLLGRPEFKAMFLDDLLNGSRKQCSAPLADVLLFSRGWGFDLADVAVPVTWWHGDADHIVPFDHGTHTVSRLPRAELRVLAGESHLGGLAVGEEILSTLVER
ncbi:alpha/beta hydrolase [soil metagenome]